LVICHLCVWCSAEIARLKEKIRELEALNQSLGETNAVKDQALRLLVERLALASTKARELTHLLHEEEEGEEDDNSEEYDDSDSEGQGQDDDDDDDDEDMDEEGEGEGEGDQKSIVQ